MLLQVGAEALRASTVRFAQQAFKSVIDGGAVEAASGPVAGLSNGQSFQGLEGLLPTPEHQFSGAEFQQALESHAGCTCTTVSGDCPVTEGSGGVPGFEPVWSRNFRHHNSKESMVQISKFSGRPAW